MIQQKESTQRSFLPAHTGEEESRREAALDYCILRYATAGSSAQKSLHKLRVLDNKQPRLI